MPDFLGVDIGISDRWPELIKPYKRQRVCAFVAIPAVLQAPDPERRDAWETDTLCPIGTILISGALRKKRPQDFSGLWWRRGSITCLSTKEVTDE